VPAGRQPLKHGNHVASPQQRLEMARLACAGNPGLAVSAAEVEREGLSYTVTTLEQLHDAGLGELHFILGADALADMYRWHQAPRIPELAHIVAVARPGHEPDIDAATARLPALAGRVTVLEGPRMELSSSDIRRRIAAGRPVRYLMPDPVIAYIAANQLYRED
jgi:nicotinate-nucleotide adenylyltransferase